MSNRTLPLLLAGISFILLAFEIVILRVLSFLQWYHFAYLIISLALLGFASSGTLFILFRHVWLRWPHITGSLSLILTGLSMATGRHLLAWIPMDNFLAVWQPSELVWPFLLGLLLFLPFLFGAFFIILCFNIHTHRIGPLYGANLLGSGMGSIGALLLLELWHPLIIPYGLALVSVSLGLLLTRHKGLMAFIGTLALILVAWLGLNPSDARMSRYKPLARILTLPETELWREIPGPMGVISVVRSPHLRSAEGLSLSYQGEVPPRPMVFLDGTSPGVLPMGVRPAERMPILHSLLSLPYRTRNVQKVLILEAGTGLEIQRARMHGVRDITAVEKNKSLLHLLRRGIPGYVSIYETEGVRAVSSGSRGFLRGDRNRYDLVVIPPVEGLTGAIGGMQSLYENYLLTAEALSAMYDRLSDRGMIVIAARLDEPPRHPLKLFALLAETLREKGISDPSGHLAAVRSWNMVEMVLSRPALKRREIDRITSFADQEGFDLLYPIDPDHPEKKPHHRLADDSLPRNLAGLAAAHEKEPDSPFFLSPPTDDKPYFAHFITLKALPYMWHTFGPAGMVLLEWGYVLLGVTLILLGLAGFCLVLLPLWIWRMKKGHPTSPLRMLAYFAAIGAGFMFVEILFIQKFMLILDEPVYTVASVITSLLVFAGLGSILSARINHPPEKIILWGGTSLILILAMFPFLLPAISDIASGQSVFLRTGLVIPIMALPGLIMGLFFPAGIRALEETGNKILIPWAWGINGFVSVISPPLATLSSLNLGFLAMGAMGIGFYFLAILSRPNVSGTPPIPTISGHQTAVP